LYFLIKSYIEKERGSERSITIKRRKRGCDHEEVGLVLSYSLSLALFPMLSAGNEEGGGERNHYIYELVVYN
jgi:hypothetical protein